MMNAAEIEIPVETEADRVICWRASELIRAGYPDNLAVDLAERLDVDLHAALELVERGCPPDVAARILR
jgi:hypothetical protein